MCAGASVELFYPEGKRFAALQAQVIADYCDVCPVVRECLAASLAEEDGAALSHRFGVRGGLGPAQRFELAQLREGPEAVAMLDAGALALE